jgi:hypothetical protein
MERGVQKTRRGTYSTYWTSSLKEAPGRTMTTGDLLIEDNPVGFSPTLAPAGLLRRDRVDEILTQILHITNKRRKRNEDRKYQQ